MSRTIELVGVTGKRRENPTTKAMEDEWEFLITKPRGSTSEFFTLYELTQERKKQRLIRVWKDKEFAARTFLGAPADAIQRLFRDRKNAVRRIGEVDTMSGFINDPEG